MLVRVLTLRNIGNSQLPLDIDPPLMSEGTDATGTEATSGDITLFEGEGTVILQPGRIFRIEEDRVDLGQIENLVSLNQLKAEVRVRSLTDLTLED